MDPLGNNRRGHPDGKQIAYLRNKGADWSIYIATLDGKEERLSWCGRTGGFPAWSPDGTEIVFAAAHAIGQAPLATRYSQPAYRKRGNLSSTAAVTDVLSFLGTGWYHHFFAR